MDRGHVTALGLFLGNMLDLVLSLGRAACPVQTDQLNSQRLSLAQYLSFGMFDPAFCCPHPTEQTAVSFRF
jgi:hypothetical protein